MSAQRPKSGATADRRPVGFEMPGLPWWAAVAIAATATALGVALDAGAGRKELTNVFAVLYVLGCLTAVLVVRRSGVFTAVIQPPLILFFAVPGAYWLFHGTSLTDIKGIAINCGYPLIERFPLMLFTSAGVLLIGMGHWYLSAATRAATAKAGAEAATRSLRRVGPVMEKLVAKLVAAVNARPAHATAGSASGRRRPADRSRRHASGSGGSGSGRRSTPPRSRAHDTADLRDQPPRRRRPAPARGEESPSGSRYGRARHAASGTPRSAPTRSRHVRPPLDDPLDNRTTESLRRRPAPPRGEEPPRHRHARPPVGDLPDPYDQPARHRRARPPQDAARGDKPAWQPPEVPRRRRPARQAGDAGSNGFSATHHPVSRVRYRSAEPGDESDAQPRARSPRPRIDDAESWQYDI